MKLLKSTDFGIEKYGYNDDVDGAETIWTGGGAFPWASVGTNATTTIESSSTDDDTGGTGLITCQVEGLVSTTIKNVTGYKIVRETATLNGTDAVTLTNLFAFVYRISGLTSGSGLANAGAISVKHSTTTIAHVLAGTNNTEMAVMIVPQFTSEGALIQGAWLLDWNSTMAKNSAANATMALKSAADSNNIFGIKDRGNITQDAPIIRDYPMGKYLKPGARIECAATAVSAADQAITANFTLIYDI